MLYDAHRRTYSSRWDASTMKRARLDVDARNGFVSRAVSRSVFLITRTCYEVLVSKFEATLPRFRVKPGVTSRNMVRATSFIVCFFEKSPRERSKVHGPSSRITCQWKVHLPVTTQCHVFISNPTAEVYHSIKSRDVRSVTFEEEWAIGRGTQPGVPT